MITPEDLWKLQQSAYMPLPQRDPNISIWELSATDIIEEFEHDLKGETLNLETQKWESPKDEDTFKLCNDYAISFIKSVIRTHVNKVVFLSNLDFLDIKEMCRNIELDLIPNFLQNLDKYKISIDNFEILLDKIIHFVYIALNRALDEGERKFRSSSERRSVIITQEPKKEESGLLNLFRRGR